MTQSFLPDAVARVMAAVERAGGAARVSVTGAGPGAPRGDRARTEGARGRAGGPRGAGRAPTDGRGAGRAADDREGAPADVPEGGQVDAPADGQGGVRAGVPRGVPRGVPVGVQAPAVQALPKTTAGHRKVAARRTETKQNATLVMQQSLRLSPHQRHATPRLALGRRPSSPDPAGPDRPRPHPT